MFFFFKSTLENRKKSQTSYSKPSSFFLYKALLRFQLDSPQDRLRSTRLARTFEFFLFLYKTLLLFQLDTPHKWTNGPQDYWRCTELARTCFKGVKKTQHYSLKLSQQIKHWIWAPKHRMWSIHFITYRFEIVSAKSNSICTWAINTLKACFV